MDMKSPGAQAKKAQGAASSLEFPIEAHFEAQFDAVPKNPDAYER